MNRSPDSSIVREWGKYRQPQRSPRVPVWVLVMLLVASGLGALAITVWLAVRPHPWRPPSGSPAFVSCTYGGRISAWCARLAVPEDPQRPDGRSISLRIAVLPATTRPAAGALFYLEGGPGGAASQSAVLVNTLFAQVERNRDIVMVDERGTGGSNRLTCPGLTPQGSADAVAAYVRRCFAGLRADPRLYTSSVAADDLEAVRQALGYGKVDLFGASYGATLAQVYLHLFPTSVRTAVLSSASLTSVRLYDTSARNAEHALDALLERCAGADACRRAFPNTRRELAQLLMRGPRRVATPGSAVVLGPDEVSWTIDSLSETPTTAATLPFAIHAAWRGDYLPLARAYATDLGSLGRLALFWEAVCSEPWAGLDPAVTARLGAGSYLVHAAVDRARVLRDACRAVPRGRVAPGAFDAATSTRVPVLMLAGGADPLDPAANVRGWQHVFPEGRLVVVPGAGHGTIEYGCVQTLVARFVEGGSAAHLDATCVRHVHLPPFMTG